MKKYIITLIIFTIITNVVYSSDPNMRLLTHLYGGNLIYERISNGKRYLELYNSTSSSYSL